MVALKCKVCGGELVLKGNQIACCKECENLMLLPVIDSDIRNDMFNRGNYYRMNYEYERAAQAFEQIIARDPEDAEARFCLALCHYGVEYVRDPRSGEYLPTCHRGNTYSILDDVDYQAAVKYAPVQIQEGMKKQAEQIHRIWQQIMDIARYEDPYDVFICYKESPGLGANPEERIGRSERTQDSVLAQELYDELTARGLRVFFSRITLQNKLGSDYEAHIFAALQSAKVMLVVGTRRDYIEAVWVKNEWQRFMHLRRQDRSREIIPVLRDMDEYDLPDEFADCIPRNIDETGVRQDLIRGILKITGHTEGSIGMIRNRELETLADKLLEQGNWEDAETAADQMLNLNPENGAAYRILFLASVKTSRLDACREMIDNFEDGPAFARLKKYAKGNLQREVDELVSYREKRSFYLKAQEFINAKNFEAAYEALVKAGDYRDAAVLAAGCKRKAEEQRATRELKENIGRYKKEVSRAWDEVEREWETTYPEVVKRRNLLRLAVKDYHRPAYAGAFWSIVALGLGCMASSVNGGGLIGNGYAFFGLYGLASMMVFMYKLSLFILPKLGKVIRFLVADGVGFLVGGVMYFNCQMFLEEKFLETLPEIQALALSWMCLLAVNMLLHLILFFVDASKFVSAENTKMEEAYCSEEEIPALKRQLFERKMENVRGEYERLIGTENCKKYAGMKTAE